MGEIFAANNKKINYSRLCFYKIVTILRKDNINDYNMYGVKSIETIFGYASLYKPSCSIIQI